MKRSSGILMPLFSLPGPFGIGCMGPEAIDFAKILSEANVEWWQVLPLNPTSAGDSPYQCLSAYAGNPYFIDLRPLVEKGLLTQEECREETYHGPEDEIDYGWLFQRRDLLLHKAYARLSRKQMAKIEAFAQNQSWLKDYALFSSIKKYYNHAPWWQWPDEGLRLHDKEALATFENEEKDEICYTWFVQHEFWQQWNRLKEKIHELGVRIIGDMPIYVAADSADVWAESHYFEMDENHQFERVAGVPPDYFSKNGQLWGNPLYRWDRLAENDYAWWKKRIAAALDFYDVVRIDHFRGFESYWAVPAGEKTAKKGVWEKGPAMKLFDHIFKAFPDAPIIAEDLGDINDSVRSFLRKTGLPGMKVLQFAFDPYFDATDRPHSYKRNMVAYSGTHDNDTLLGWLDQCDDSEWQLICDYFGFEPDERKKILAEPRTTEVFMRTLWQSVADLVVAPAQDLVGLGSEARINTPGTQTGNWRFRFTQNQLEGIDCDWLARLTKVCQR